MLGSEGWHEVAPVVPQVAGGGGKRGDSLLGGAGTKQGQ